MDTLMMLAKNCITDAKNGSSSSCPPLWDGVLCWPETQNGTDVTLPCPRYVNGFDVTKSVVKKCLSTGWWESLSDAEVMRSYDVCHTEELRELMNIYRSSGGEEMMEMKLEIAKGTRALELCGLTVSLLALAISLAIFFKLEILYNYRTRIHRCLFSSMLVHVTVRLVLYIDQLIVRSNFSAEEVDSSQGIENTAHICRLFYVMLEYTRTAMFMWMFVEGFHLYYTVIAFRQEIRFCYYHLIAWGTPVIFTTLWAAYTAVTNLSNCWFAYNHSKYYWILEGPRLAIITVNFIFLLIVIRVLVTKLLHTPDQPVRDYTHIRKAVKAAVILLPLLGITNFLTMSPAPLHRSAIEFALWSVSSHFLTSFQGTFISLLYCFLNEEVQEAVKRNLKSTFRSRFLRDRRESTISNSKLGASSVDTNPIIIPLNSNPSIGEERATNNCQIMSTRNL